MLPGPAQRPSAAPFLAWLQEVQQPAGAPIAAAAAAAAAPGSGRASLHKPRVMAEELMPSPPLQIPILGEPSHAGPEGCLRPTATRAGLRPPALSAWSAHPVCPCYDNPVHVPFCAPPLCGLAGCCPCLLYPPRDAILSPGTPLPAPHVQRACGRWRRRSRGWSGPSGGTCRRGRRPARWWGRARC